ncbi:MAG TPA: alpha/beta hydrolase [Streptomyces sp.]|uniref:Alpha/beta fold hydrolase n=1 Tax=Streptomyces salyersiae TaxID=3075530 RepID=A0ABU2RK39_9ACTN|nr:MULTISPECIES: alpha/beta fold hydrolase [unclassified Streptomyces]MBK3591875.1 alpha/beta fold hydrolase [Streptomyces sp. MBT51]MDT0429217.1 alpha/beta fold hydrolase [Streptomyces sp. DSM 41770]HBF83149.1 alpha/beta hydrolase [Streptomyces sp.]
MARRIRLGRCRARTHRARPPPRSAHPPGPGRRRCLRDARRPVGSSARRGGRGARSRLGVGHSAASTLAWLAADARPEKVAKVALVGGFPTADGKAYADYFAIEGGVMPFPGWEPFEGPDAADLDQQARDRFASAAVPVPEAVARGVVRLTDERRFDIPVVVVCPEFTPAQAEKWIATGESPELARAAHVEYVDLDSGHWPMATRPRELARVLAEAAHR